MPPGSDSTGTTTETPRRRRWLPWLILSALCIAVAGAVLWENHQARATQAWLAQASRDHPLIMKYDTVCMIPGFRDYDALRHVLGRRQITIVVFHPDDADKLLAMPPCPVKLVVDTTASTPPEVVTRLRERFGSDVE